MNHFHKMTGAIFSLVLPTLILLVESTALAQGQSGPPTPTAEGTSPLLGYMIAVVLVVLLVVVSIIPSKRNFDDI
jgi:hypothetical protein